MSFSSLERYCRGLDDWPHSWMEREKDLPPHERLVTGFRPFLEYQVHSDLSPKTIQKLVNNMWVLGGEVKRNPSLRKVPVERFLSDLVEDRGPLLYHSDSDGAVEVVRVYLPRSIPYHG